MNQLLVLGLVLGLVFAFLVTFLIFSERMARRTHERLKRKRAEYMDRTLPCPTCFGRKRICREGWKFTDDTPEKEYKEEMSVIDIPFTIRDSMKRGK